MSDLPEEMTTVAPGVYWDNRRDTCFVRAMGLSPSDLPGFIVRFRQVLEAEPSNAALRYVLASYLQMDGQNTEARAELERVVHSSDETWAAKARQLLEMATEAAIS